MIASVEMVNHDLVNSVAVRIAVDPNMTTHRNARYSVQG